MGLPDQTERVRLHSDHLQSNPDRKLGPQTARLRPCAKKPAAHGHHPDNEPCPYCGTPDKTPGQLWYEHHFPQTCVEYPWHAMDSADQDYYEHVASYQAEEYV